MRTLLLLTLFPAFAMAQAGYPNTENFGVDVDKGADWYQQCLKVADANPAPSPSVRAAPKCDAADAYYLKLDQAVTSDVEWAAVRSCAIATNNTAVLSMLYANGLGVPRNAAVATRYACSTGAALAEMEGRVQHLASLAPNERYDHCDNITSGTMGAVCSAIAARRAERIKTAFTKRLRSSLAPAQTAAFDRLLSAGQAFAKTHAENETSPGGSGYAGFVIDAQARENEWLREHLAAFEKGQFPPAANFAADDAELNRLYGARMHPAQPDPNAVQPDAIRATQRLWLAYRDAWVAFAVRRYPQMDAAALKALLTQWRIKQLQGV
ncbi:MAG: lysozyme inhibitor LprI family protein [Massilia sp.]